MPTKIKFTVDLSLVTTPLQIAAQLPTSKWSANQLRLLVDLSENQRKILTG